MLTNLEVVKLKKVLIRDNRFVTAVRYVNQCIGIGGSNTYNMDRTQGVHEYTLAELDASDIRYVNINEDIYDYPYELAIAAVVEDVLYLIHRYDDNGGGVTTYHYSVSRLCLGEKISDWKEGISYDTDWYFELCSVSDHPEWETAYVKPELPQEAAYTAVIRGFDLLPARAQAIIARRRELETEISAFEWSDPDIRRLFSGYRHEYFDAKERAQELEHALEELRTAGRIARWRGGSEFTANSFDAQLKENPNRAKEFEEILMRGLPLYQEMCALRTEPLSD